MSTPIIFALFSLFFSGLIDVVFKQYNSQDRSRGILIFGIGLLWGGLHLIDMQLGHNTLSFDSATWIYGGIAGICVALANITLLEALRYMDVSFGSTIYRLNTIGVVILSVLFLGETVSALKLAGIICGIIAVLLLYHRQGKPSNQLSLKIGLTIAVSASLLRALYGVITKAGLSAGADMNTLILIAAGCWIISGFSYAFFMEQRYAISVKKIAYICVCSLLAYGNVKCLMTALNSGEVSIVVPIANMSFLVALLIALIFKMEKLNLKKSVAMGFAVSAIVLLAQS